MGDVWAPRWTRWWKGDGRLGWRDGSSRHKTTIARLGQGLVTWGWRPGKGSVYRYTVNGATPTKNDAEQEGHGRRSRCVLNRGSRRRSRVGLRGWRFFTWHHARNRPVWKLAHRNRTWLPHLASCHSISSSFSCAKDHVLGLAILHATTTARFAPTIWGPLAKALLVRL